MKTLAELQQEENYTYVKAVGIRLSLEPRIAELQAEIDRWQKAYKEAVLAVERWHAEHKEG